MEHYLILHKVRGVAAFDVAQKMEVEGETWWITSTYGHRAYPYWHQLIDDSNIPSMPEGVPEHFEVYAAPKSEGIVKNARSALERLGLLKAREPLTRRSW